MNFADRLSQDRYKNDVQCTIRLQPDPRDELRSAMTVPIPYRLLGRLRCLGQAYELPLLSRLPGNGHAAYHVTQMASLEDELAFVCEVVDDADLLEVLQLLGEHIGEARHRPRGWSLVFESARSHD